MGKLRNGEKQKSENEVKNILSYVYSSSFDGMPTKNEKYATQLVAVHTEFVERNRKLTNLLSDYILQRSRRIKTNYFFKKFIFWFFIGMTFVLTVSVILFVAILKPIYSVKNIVSLVSVLVTYLVSIISVFEIISKYLFPLDEEKDAISMIKTVIDNDVKVEDMMSKAIDKNNQDGINRLAKFKELLDSNAITPDDFKRLKDFEIEKWLKQLDN